MPQHPVPAKIDWRIINALRGLAALYVVINHSRGVLFTDAMDYAAHVNPKPNWQWWEWLNMLLMQHSNLGTEFVILFFVLSGFSIAHSLRQNPKTSGFYFRRLVRLYPTYLVGIIWAILAFLAIKYIAPEIYYTTIETEQPLQHYFHNFIDLPNLLKNLFYYPVNNFLTMQYWSLPYEVVFYFIAPWAVRRFRWYGVITVILYLLGWLLYGMSYTEKLGGTIPLQFTFDFGIYFLVGMIFYRKKEYLLNTFKLNKAFVFISLAVIFEILVWVKGYYWQQEHNKISGMFMMLFTYISLIGFMKYNIRIPVLEKIGVYSYTLYVTHLATIHIVASIAFYYGLGFYSIRIVYFWYTGIAASLLCAYLLFRVAEYPSTKYLERLRKNKDGIKAPGVAAIESN